MLTIFVRSILLYIAALFAMRIMGKREVGQLQPFEIVVVIMIAELAATPMGGVGIPLIYGVLPMVALVVCHGIISAASMKWQPFRAWLSGTPTILMRHGALCEKQMRKAAMDVDDLLESLRTAGYPDPAEVDAAILESGGKLTVVPKSAHRPVTPEDLGLHVPPTGPTLTLVVDGRIQQEDLARAGLSPRWLQKRVTGAGIRDVSDVLLLTLNAQGDMLIQGKGSAEARCLPALEIEKVVW